MRSRSVKGGTARGRRPRQLAATSFAETEAQDLQQPVRVM